MQKKAYLPLIIIVLVGIVSVYVFSDRTVFPNNENGHVVESQNEAELLKDIKENPEDYELVSLEEGQPKNLIILPIQESISTGKKLNGLRIVEFLNEPSILWQIKSELPYGNFLNNDLIDIDNDGTKEIISYWATGTQSINMNIWIFRHESGVYKLINPIYDENNQLTPSFDMSSTTKEEFDRERLKNAFDGQNIFVEDIDNDKRMEISIVNVKVLDENKAEKNTKIYKFNGAEYSLWKENTEPVQ